MKLPSVSLRALRAATAVVAAVAMLVLGLFALLNATVTDRTTRNPRPASSGLPGGYLPIAAPLSITPVPTGSRAAPASTPLSSNPPTPANSSASDTAPAAAPASRPSTKAPSTSPVTKPPFPIPSAPVGAAACPFALPATKDTGGLQSLISLAPAFGPFSAEAFAMASAYQPLLQVLGPVLARYPALAPKIAPLVGPVVSGLASAEEAFFQVIGPFYAAQRNQVLQAEGQLAAALAPYAEKIATSSSTSCVVDLEALLLPPTT